MGLVLSTGVGMVYINKPAETLLVKRPTDAESTLHAELSSEDRPETSPMGIKHSRFEDTWRRTQQGSSLLNQTIHEEESF